MKDSTTVIFIILIGGFLLSQINLIGNIIIIFIGLVLFIFPKIRSIDSLKNKEEAILWTQTASTRIALEAISWIRIALEAISWIQIALTRVASIFIILSGITGLLSGIANLINYIDFLLVLQFFFLALGVIALLVSGGFKNGGGGRYGGDSGYSRGGGYSGDGGGGGGGGGGGCGCSILEDLKLKKKNIAMMKI